MIKFQYIYEDSGTDLGLSACILIQENSESPFLILDDDEILGQLDIETGCWHSDNVRLEQEFIKSVSRFIKAQQFLKLPKKIRDRWPDEVQEVIVKSESAYLVVTKPGINFISFEKIFRNFIEELVKDEWEVVFEVFSTNFDDDFVVKVRKSIR